MRVRPAIPTDSDAWRLLWKGYQDYYEVDLSDSTEDTWARLLAEESNGPLCLVCEDEGDELVGFATYLFHGHTWQPEPRCYLIDLFSTPKLRGKGIGRALIEAVYEKADVWLLPGLLAHPGFQRSGTPALRQSGKGHAVHKIPEVMG